MLLASVFYTDHQDKRQKTRKARKERLIWLSVMLTKKGTMKYNQTSVVLESLTFGDNPRIETNLNLNGLRDSIESVGLLEPITVWEREKNVIEVVRGHRRTMAIRLLSNTNPKRFGELFTKGIPCLKVSDITREEVIVLKLDHAEQQSLADPHELQRSANMLFAIDKTESEVASQLATLIDRLTPMRQKNRLELQALQAKLETVKTSGNVAGIQLAEREIKDYLFAYRRGFVQNLHNTFRCPICVMSALYKRATGKNPEGVTEFLPALTQADVTKLWSCHKADLEIRENGIPKYNRERIGPNFTTAWEKLVNDSQKVTEVKAPKAKAMSASDMSLEITEGKFKSELAVRLTQHHAGDRSVVDIATLDTQAYLADLVRKHDPAFWEKVVTAAKEIERRLIRQDAKKIEETK